MAPITYLEDARQEFRALWHEGEEPSRMWGRDDRRHGRRPAMASVRQRQTRRRGRTT